MKTAGIIGIAAAVFILAILAVSSNREFAAVYPINSSTITERSPAFSWRGQANQIMIDDMPDFSSPIVADVKWNYYKPSAKLELKKHYWKLVGANESPVFEFEIDGIVALQMKSSVGIYNITNSGNSRAAVETEENSNGIWGVTGLVILNPLESAVFRQKNNTRAVARQNE